MSRTNSYRSQLCGEVAVAQVGETAQLSGWVDRKRDHGGLLFLDLRDWSGICQCVVDSASPVFAQLRRVSSESVLRLRGTVRRRDPETVNASLKTGQVELAVSHYDLLSAAAPLPFPVAKSDEYPEALRLRHRYLDLRRPALLHNILLRSRVIQSLRSRMVEAGFVEIQTPILTTSSPEGARDYLVPSRNHRGTFYALPQAPQQFKQLLMVAGVDRYFQIAPCFRDEEARADRSPGEFYQLDMEMAFVEQEDVFAAVEPIVAGLFAEFGAAPNPQPPFPRIPYREAMIRYGSDKPDLRNPICMADVSELFAQSGFALFRDAVLRGERVRTLPVADAKPSRSAIDRLVAHAQSLGAGGLAYLALRGDKASGPLAKTLTESERTRLRDITGVAGDGILFFVCGPAAHCARLGAALRDHIGETWQLLATDTYRFCWITDYPMYERDPETGQIAFSHNPFSMPQGGLEALENSDPEAILAHQYDLVCNGVELSSGAIRNHLPELMIKAFAIAGYPPEEVATRFPALLSAFRYGAPPHGGLAPGIDRILMLLVGESNIREVICFPMNQQAQDLMMGAPGPVPAEHLAELGITITPLPGDSDGT